MAATYDTHDLRVYLGALREAAGLVERHLAVLDTADRVDAVERAHERLVSAVELGLVAMRRLHAIVDEQRARKAGGA